MMMENEIEKKVLWLLCLVLLFVTVKRGEGATDDLATKCTEVVQKVIPCMNFATGKEATPTKQCCDAANNIKESNPECLCYIIQQTHKGSPEIKSMGIQEAKLLQLPSACNVKNASISNCPKLLGLSPSSPDAAIFTNASKITPPSSSSSEQATTTPQSQNGSFGSMVRPSLMMVALAIVLILAVPTELMFST